MLAIFVFFLYFEFGVIAEMSSNNFESDFVGGFQLEMVSMKGPTGLELNNLLGFGRICSTNSCSDSTSCCIGTGAES